MTETIKSLEKKIEVKLIKVFKLSLLLSKKSEKMSFDVNSNGMISLWGIGGIECCSPLYSIYIDHWSFLEGNEIILFYKKQIKTIDKWIKIMESATNENANKRTYNKK